MGTHLIKFSPIGILLSIRIYSPDLLDDMSAPHGVYVGVEYPNRGTAPF